MWYLFCCCLLFITISVRPIILNLKLGFLIPQVMLPWQAILLALSTQESSGDSHQMEQIIVKVVVHVSHWVQALVVHGCRWTQAVCGAAVLFSGRPWFEGWPNHGWTFSIYFCPLSLWLTLPKAVLSTSWCCPSRPCVVFLTCVHLELFLVLSPSPGNSRFLMAWP